MPYLMFQRSLRMQVLVLMGGVLSLAAAAGVQLRTFRLFVSSDYTAAILDTPRQVASFMSCARMCDSEYSNCLSFTFNYNTQACTPRSMMTYEPSNPVRPAEEVFYYIDVCNTAMGFRLFVYGSVIQCLYVSSDKVNLFSARAICEEKDSKLVMIKSRDKFQFLYYVMDSVLNTTSWIGLSDVLTENHFVWEDNEPANFNGSFRLLWGPGQPDNASDGEDCVSLRFGFLNDVTCHALYRFICERNILP